MIHKLALSLLLGMGVFCHSTLAHSWDLHRPDAHAPIAVMGDHLHKGSEWMFSYRLSRMGMSGLRSGTTELSKESVLSDFMVAPLSMEMEMHMFGAMYGLSDSETLMVMLPYTRKSMDHQSNMGMSFSTLSEGLGDAKVLLLKRVSAPDTFHAHFQAGVSLPIGAIDQTDETPMGSNTVLPYGMQLGSGTVDFLPAMTLVKYAEDWSMGAQVQSVLRLGENTKGYTLGNTTQISSWVSKVWTAVASTSLRATFSTKDNVSGQKPTQLMAPTQDPSRQGGQRLDISAGLNLYLAPDNRIAIEYGVPVYQNLEGPQLAVDSWLTAGWQLNL